MRIRKKYKLFYIIWILLILLIVSCSEKPKIKSLLGFAISEKSIDDFIESKMELLKVNGASIAVINNGNIVYHKVKGYADAENNIRIDKETIFEGASLSKPVFAYFVLQFVEEGLLDLDMPLYKYLPHPEIENDDRYKKITARMVLSHTSGLPNWREFEKDKKLKLLFNPGERYNYSGEGYQYLAQVMRHLLKTDWNGLEKTFQRKVAAPLELVHTSFIQNDHSRKHKAEPYTKGALKIDWTNSYWYKKNDMVFGAASTIHTEALDYSKWLIALMDKKGLSQASYNELLKEHAVTPHKQFGNVKYALGFFKSDLPFGTIYSHEGGQEGFSSWFSMDVEKKWAIVLFTNSESGGKLGLELTLFLLFGKSISTVYWIIGPSLLLLFLVSIYVVRKYRRKRKQKLNQKID